MIVQTHNKIFPDLSEINSSSLCRNRPWESGLSYVEVLIATFLVAIALVPALDAMHSGIAGAGVHTELARNHYRLSEKVEELFAQPYFELAAEAATAGGSNNLVDAYSDAAGTADRRMVYLAFYDGHTRGFVGSDTGLLWIRVAIEGGPQSVQTLVKH